MIVKFTQGRGGFLPKEFREWVVPSHGWHAQPGSHWLEQASSWQSYEMTVEEKWNVDVVRAYYGSPNYILQKGKGLLFRKEGRIFAYSGQEFSAQELQQLLAGTHILIQRSPGTCTCRVWETEAAMRKIQEGETSWID